MLMKKYYNIRDRKFSRKGLINMTKPSFKCWNCHRIRRDAVRFAEFVNVESNIFLYFCTGSRRSKKTSVVSCKYRWIAKGMPNLERNITNEVPRL